LAAHPQADRSRQQRTPIRLAPYIRERWGRGRIKPSDYRSSVRPLAIADDTALCAPGRRPVEGSGWQSWHRHCREREGRCNAVARSAVMKKRTRPLTPAEISAFQSIDGPDTDFKIAACLEGLRETGEPIYAWRAIRICLADKVEFPHWIKGYLGQCVMRMDSPKARKSGDLRKVLPWVLGFPANRKRGPRKNNLMADTRMAIFPTLFTDYVISEGLGPGEPLTA